MFLVDHCLCEKLHSQPRQSSPLTRQNPPPAFFFPPPPLINKIHRCTFSPSFSNFSSRPLHYQLAIPVAPRTIAPGIPCQRKQKLCLATSSPEQDPGAGLLAPLARLICAAVAPLLNYSLFLFQAASGAFFPQAPGPLSSPYNSPGESRCPGHDRISLDPPPPTPPASSLIRAAAGIPP